MKLTVAAYLAGIIDGEGNIGITRGAPRKRCGEITPIYYDYVKVANTDYRVLAWIRDKVGLGTIYIENRNKPNSRKVYTWHIASNQCHAFLKAVYPYLVIKKEQADLVFQFRKTFNPKRNCKKGLPKEVLQQREKLFRDLQTLHKTVIHGPPVYNPTTGNPGQVNYKL